MSALFSKAPGDVPIDKRERDKSLLVLLADFDQHYPSEGDCVETLIRTNDEGSRTRCRSCFCDEINRKYGDRIGRCASCNGLVRMTAASFFNGIRLPRAWLFLISLMEHGFSFNACELHRATGYSTSALDKIIKKISLVLYHYLGDFPESTSEYSECFLPVFFKRSLETPVRSHPASEQIQMELNDASKANVAGISSTLPLGREGGKQTDFDNASEPTQTEKAVLTLLTTSAVHIDEIHMRANMPIEKLSAILMMLDLKGLVESNGGSRFALPTPANAANGMPPNPRSASSAGRADLLPANVSAAIGFIRSEFHGISRKYLQLYLGLHWCSVDRTKWCCGALLQACRSFRFVMKSDIRDFVTPLLVKIGPEPKQFGCGSTGSAWSF